MRKGLTNLTTLYINGNSILEEEVKTYLKERSHQLDLYIWRNEH